MDDVEIEAGIEDVDIEVSQEQEEIEQENEAEQDGAAYATADYSGDVYVEQDGELTAGTLLSDGAGGFTPEGDGIDASSVADAEADLNQLAVQSNSNSQAITEDADPLTPAFGFTADATFNAFGAAAGDDVEIGAGIEEVDLELEQEQEEIDQDNSAEQYGEAEAYAYSGEVDVEQTGELFAAEDGVDATSRAEASAELEQQAGQNNVNDQSAATSLAFDASPSFGTTTGTAVAEGGGFSLRKMLSLLRRSTMSRSRQGLRTSRLRSTRSRRRSSRRTRPIKRLWLMPRPMLAMWSVTSGTDEVPVDPLVGDTGIDAASDADADVEPRAIG